MPVRFRCAHCGQLLGIAETKAGSEVDCPVCGRSVHVPSSGEQHSRPAGAAKHDPELTRALSQLTGFGENQSPTEEPSATTPQPKGQFRGSAEDATKPVPHTVSPDLQPPPLEGSETPVLIDDDADVGSDSTAWKESLKELSSDESPAVPAPADPRPSIDGRWRVALLSVFVIGIVFGAVVRGLFTSHTPGGPTNALPEQDPQNAAAEDNDLPRVVDAGILHGTVTWTEPGRDSSPDSGALVLLLPVRREGTWLLDSRALRSDAVDVEQAAITAALNALGASVQVTDEDGQFELQKRSEAAAALIVISRHVTETDGSLEANVRDALARWFENPAQLVGRLAAKSISVPEGTAPSSALSIAFP